MVLNQNPERLNPQTLNALTTNRSHLLTSALNSKAAALLTKEWGRRVNPEAVTQLARYRFIAQVTHRGELSRPFGLEGIRVEDVAEPPSGNGAESSRGPAARAESAEVMEHLETLDDRILAALRKRRKQAGQERASLPSDGRAPTQPRSVWVPERRIADEQSDEPRNCGNREGHRDRRLACPAPDPLGSTGPGHPPARQRRALGAAIARAARRRGPRRLRPLPALPPSPLARDRAGSASRPPSRARSMGSRA